jgi:DNA-directed RNA polymerase specialized sigma24 family protein
VVTGDLIRRARTGDGEAFRALTEPHRRELQVHCYRMLGSFQDAEDALQDTLLAAWQGLGEFGGRRLAERSALRHRLVAILRDVLGFHANEVADMLDSTVESVNSALKRARASLQRGRPPSAESEPAPAHGSPSEDAIVAKFVSAWESADLDALVALLTDDVFVSMPPMPFEYEGRDVVARFCASLFGAGRRFDLVPTRANGQPAFGAYLRASSGIRHGTGLYVLTLTGDVICAMTRFDNSVLPWSGCHDRSQAIHITRRTGQAGAVPGTEPPREHVAQSPKSTRFRWRQSTNR